MPTRRAFGSKISRNATVSFVRMASNIRCTVARTAFSSAGSFRGADCAAQGANGERSAASERMPRTAARRCWFIRKGSLSTRRLQSTVVSDQSSSHQWTGLQQSVLSEPVSSEELSPRTELLRNPRHRRNLRRVFFHLPRADAYPARVKQDQTLISQIASIAQKASAGPVARRAAESNP